MPKPELVNTLSAFEEMPAEILVSILQYLTIKDLQTIQTVSKHINDVINVNFMNFNFSNKVFFIKWLSSEIAKVEAQIKSITDSMTVSLTNRPNTAMIRILTIEELIYAGCALAMFVIFNEQRFSNFLSPDASYNESKDILSTILEIADDNLPVACTLVTMFCLYQYNKAMHQLKPINQAEFSKVQKLVEKNPSFLPADFIAKNTIQAAVTKNHTLIDLLNQVPSRLHQRATALSELLHRTDLAHAKLTDDNIDLLAEENRPFAKSNLILFSNLHPTKEIYTTVPEQHPEKPKL